MNNPACAETAALVAGLLVGFLDIRAIWSMDHEPEGTDAPRLRPTLLVFADTATLRRLHSTPHMPGMEVLVVTDGDAVESAWQRAQMHASLARWAEDGKTVVRLRRKAQLVWQRPAGEKSCAQS